MRCGPDYSAAGCRLNEEHDAVEAAGGGHAEPRGGQLFALAMQIDRVSAAALSIPFAIGLGNMPASNI